MCVIIIKRKGVPLPARNILEACHHANPHGMGFVSSSGKYYRGMDYKRFLFGLDSVGKEEECIIHFRIATHGSICPENCHPFRSGSVWFAHNGILPILAEGNMTDSETAFRNVLIPAIERFGIESDEFAATVNSIIGTSRLAFMVDGKAYCFGTYYYLNGCYYSNMRFLSGMMTASQRR